MKASIQLLTNKEQAELMRNALRILAEVGVKIPGASRLPALKLIAASGSGDDVVCFEEEVIRWALKVAPRQIPIYDQSDEHIFSLGGQDHKKTRFGIGVTNLYYQDPQDGAVTPFTRSTFRQAVHIGDALEGYDFVSTPGILQDMPPDQADLAACMEMAAGTDKPLVVLVSHKPSFTKALDLIQTVQNSQRSVLPYFNPQTPLFYPNDMLQNLTEAVERGLPVILSNYGMLGASTPASLGGTASLLLAELLAGLVICQCIREEAPVILGSLPAVFDMRTMQSRYSPHTFLLNLSVHEVLSAHGISTCGTSGCEGGWGMDLRASSELWLNHLTSIMGGVDLVPFVGSIFNSRVFSPELVVYADLIIQQARQFCGGYALEMDEDLLREIKSAGHGGHFLEGKTTLQNYRRFFAPDIFPTIGLEEWQQQNCPQQTQILKEHTLELLNTHTPPEGHAERLAKGQNLLMI